MTLKLVIYIRGRLEVIERGSKLGLQQNKVKKFFHYAYAVSATTLTTVFPVEEGLL